MNDLDKAEARYNRAELAWLNCRAEVDKLKEQKQALDQRLVQAKIAARQKYYDMARALSELKK